MWALAPEGQGAINLIRHVTGARAHKPTTLSRHLTSMSVLSIPEFVARWQRSTLSERSAAQQHFMDLCEILGQPVPASVDPEATSYTYEKPVTKPSGGRCLCGRLDARLFRLEIQRQTSRASRRP